VVAALALAALLAACRGETAGPGGEAPPVAVRTVRVEQEAIPRTLAAVGTLESPHTTELGTELGGTVVFLDVPEGQRVEEGHLLARIDARRATALLSITRARSRQARDTLARMRALHAAGIVSRQELDEALAEHDAAEGGLEDAATVVHKTEIRAPFAGVLGLRLVSLGAYLEPGTPVVRLTQTRPLHLVFSLPQRHAARVRAGQAVRGVAASCLPFDAAVSVLDPYVDPATRAVRVQAVVPNEDERLLPGMSADVRLEVGTIPDALLVPVEAVIRRGTRRIVFAVDGDGTVEEREIALGEIFPDRVQVTRGVAAGDVVVAAGHQKLRRGSRVAPEPYAPVENPNLALGSNGAGGAAPGCEP
jgi:membrane fusion protein (multidrug efflux system)